MKRILFTLIAIALMAAPVFAAEVACTQGTAEKTIIDASSGNQVRLIKVTWTSDAGGELDGTDNCDVTINGYIHQVITDPHATAPTTLYDIAFLSSVGGDVMGTALSNRSATVTEVAYPLASAVVVEPYVNGNISIEIDAAGNAKKGTIYIYVRQDRK